MVSGKLLRTNYRRTGGYLDIIAIGGAIPRSSYMGVPNGIGTNEPFGGFMVFSYSGSFEGAEASAAMAQGSGPAGCSNAWVESTHAAMSAFYGDGMFGDGYVFMPIGIDMFSFSGVNLKAGAGMQSMPRYEFNRIHTSGSLFIVSGRFHQMSGFSATATFFSQNNFGARVWGFIISAP